MNLNRKFLIALQTSNFQHRLSWMLASLTEQTIARDIAVHIAFIDDEGVPSTRTLIDTYSSVNGLHIQPMHYANDERFKYRGFVRNDQMTFWMHQDDLPWIVFADSDHVYHPEFFEKLYDHLNKDVLANDSHEGFWSAGRMSNTVEDATRAIDSMNFTLNGYHNRMKGAWDAASKIPLHQKSNVGAGHTQIVHKDAKGHEGYYVKEEENKDWDWHKKGQNTKSDMQFRKRIKKSAPHYKLPIWFTEHQIHLNHSRDPDVGKHLIVQR